MVFQETKLKGVFLIVPERLEDERGFFARAWCEREFRSHGCNPRLVQCSISFNRIRGTLRGMHYQAAPHPEAKVVRCTLGAIYDVILDLRPTSPSYLRWVAFELSAENRGMVYIPEGCAHGFQTLVDQTEVFYQMSAFHEPDAARGVRWNDPAFAIEWPIPEPTMSSRDRQFPDFRP